MGKIIPRNYDELLTALNDIQAQGATLDERRAFVRYVKRMRPDADFSPPQPGVGEQLTSGFTGKLKQQKEAVKTLGRGISEKAATTTPAEQFASGFMAAPKLVGGLAKALAKRGLNVAEGALKTVTSTPEAVRVTAALVSGEEPSASDLAELERAVKSQKEAVEGVAEFIPSVGAQFAVGLEKGQRTGIEQGLTPIEATAGGAVVGAERAAAMAAAKALFKKPVKEAARKVGEKKAQAAVSKKQQAITKKIEPKLTAKEKRLAIKEGRVTAGKESKLFGKKPDVVEPSTSVKQAAEVVQRRIPKANKLDKFQLSNKAQNEIAKISKEIEPALRKAKLSSKEVTGVKSAWNGFKKKLQTDPEFVAFRGSKTMQNNFQKIVDRLGKGKMTKADLWDIRKAWDKSVRETVKQANANSSASLQLQKDFWLDTRNILNKALKEGADDLAAETAKSFKDMSALYEVTENIVAGGDVATKATGGFITTDALKKTVVGGALGAAGLGGLKILTD